MLADYRIYPVGDLDRALPDVHHAGTVLNRTYLRLAVRVGNALLVIGQEKRHVGRPVGKGDVVRVADGHVEDVLHSAYHRCLLAHNG